VFTLDALLAVTILVTAASSFYLISSNLEKSNSSFLLEKKQADDILATLDKSGDLQSKNESEISANTELLMPPNMDWRVTVEYYAYSPSDGFVLNETVDMGQIRPNKESSASAERVFVTFSNNYISNYGIARIAVWPE